MEIIPWFISTAYCMITLTATSLDIFNRKFRTKDKALLVDHSKVQGHVRNETQQGQLSLIKVSCVLLKFVSCFSILSNFESVMSLEKTKNRMDYIHGLRVVLSFAVMFGHYRAFIFTRTESVPRLPIVFELRIPVSWFFMISAMLNAKTNLTKLRKGNFSAVNYVLKRYGRLGPVFYAAFFTVLYMPLIHSKASRIPDLVALCQRADWLQTFALISSWFNIKGVPQCFIHGWYVEADIQFTLATLPVLFLLKYKPKTTCLLLIFITICQTLNYSYINYYLGKNFLGRPEMTTYYPFIHAWAIGLFTGYLTWKNFQFPRIVNFIMEPFFHLICIWTPVYMTVINYQNYVDVQSVWIMNDYLAFWVLIRLHQDDKCFLARFFSHPFWLPFSRVSYSAYIFHVIFAYQIMEVSMEESMEVDTLRAVLTTFGFYAAAFIPAILIEEPFRRLLDFLT